MADKSITAKGVVDATFFASYGSVLPHTGQGLQFGDWPVNPDTDSSWTQAEIDNLEIGIQSVDAGGGSNQVVVDGTYLIVEHDETRNDRRESSFDAKTYIQLAPTVSFVAKYVLLVPGDRAVGAKAGFFSGNRVFPIPPSRREIIDPTVRLTPTAYP